MRNKLYVHKRDILSQENIYRTKRLPGFVKELGYVGGVTPQDEASRRRWRGLTKILIQMDTRTKEEREVIFG